LSKYINYYNKNLKMPRISFTPNLYRHVQTPSAEVTGNTVRQALENYFQLHHQVRGYVLDDQGALRKHMAIFLNQELINDRSGLSDPVREDDDIFVVQALSGG
jgi:sulfur carrier protein ThiS